MGSVTSAISRAFTPPGTGGAEAAAIQAQTNAQTAIQQANARMAQMTQTSQLSGADAPAPPKAPAAPPQFQAGQKQQAKGTPSVLGAFATAGQQSRKTSVLG